MAKILLQFLLTCVITLGSFTCLAQKHTIHITDFFVTAKAQKIIIDWKTDGETATNYFAIQKSVDGINYKTMALVLGADPKQKGCDCYGCFDKYNPKTTKSYYRLVHIDVDGTEQISEPKLLSKS